MASLSCATIAAHSRRCRVAEISLLFVRTTADSLFAPEFSFGHREQPSSQPDCKCTTRSGFSEEAMVMVELGCMREVQRGVSWNRPRRLLLWLLRPHARFRRPSSCCQRVAKVPPGNPDTATHTTYGIQHAWNQDKESPPVMEFRSTNHGRIQFTILDFNRNFLIILVVGLLNLALKFSLRRAGIPKLLLWK